MSPRSSSSARPTGPRTRQSCCRCTTSTPVAGGRHGRIHASRETARGRSTRTSTPPVFTSARSRPPSASRTFPTSSSHRLQPRWATFACSSVSTKRPARRSASRRATSRTIRSSTPAWPRSDTGCRSGSPSTRRRSGGSPVASRPSRATRRATPSSNGRGSWRPTPPSGRSSGGLWRRSTGHARRSPRRRSVARGKPRLPPTTSSTGLHVALGKPEEAVYGERALAIYQEIGNKKRIGAVLNHLAGRAYLDGRWDECLELAARAKDASIAIGDRWSAAAVGFNIGETLADQGRYEDAEPIVRDSMTVWKEDGALADGAEASSLLGRILAHLGRFDEAEALLTEALAQFGESGDDAEGLKAEARLAQLALLRGDSQAVLAGVDGLIERAERGEGMFTLVAALHRLRGEALAAVGRSGGGARRPLRRDPHRRAVGGELRAQEHGLRAGRPTRRSRGFPVSMPTRRPCMRRGGTRSSYPSASSPEPPRAPLAGRPRRFALCSTLC